MPCSRSGLAELSLLADGSNDRSLEVSLTECVVADAHGDDDDVEDPTRLRSHQRGKAPFVFVPWERIAESPLNLPVSKMDFYVPG